MLIFNFPKRSKGREKVCYKPSKRTKRHVTLIFERDVLKKKEQLPEKSEIIGLVNHLKKYIFAKTNTQSEKSDSKTIFNILK